MPWIANRINHSNSLSHARGRGSKSHKYLYKIKLGNGKYRYFYNEAEYQAYRDNLIKARDDVNDTSHPKTFTDPSKKPDVTNYHYPKTDYKNKKGVVSGVTPLRKGTTKTSQFVNILKGTPWVSEDYNKRENEAYSKARKKKKK